MEAWFAFVVSAALVIVIPGPTIVAIVGFSAVHGRAMVPVLTVAVEIAHMILLFLSAAGLGLLIRNHPAALELIQMAGAVYLVFLLIGIGIKLKTSNLFSVESDHRNQSESSRKNAIFQTFIVTLFNPNLLFYFIALLPQFIDPVNSTTKQLLLMSVTFVVLSTVNNMVYGWSSCSAADLIRSKRFQANR